MNLLEQIEALCQSVALHLKLAHEFNRKARESDQILRKMLGME